MESHSHSSLLCSGPIARLPDFHKIYQLGAIIGKGAYCTVHLATVKVDGPYKGMQVAVKCTERQNPPRLEEENLKEEVRKSASMHRGTDSFPGSQLRGHRGGCRNTGVLMEEGDGELLEQELILQAALLP